ncbi:MAG: WD40 repeat domain-containing protein [Verrucomicrobia bacterium]|nr:WD40 repeat domain-containing protein [Verrucomicrobiota bacterium]
MITLKRPSPKYETAFPRSFFCFWIFVISLSAARYAQAADVDPILWTARWNHDGSQFAIGGVHALWVFDSNTFQKKSLLPAPETCDADNKDIPYMAVTRMDWHPERDVLVVSTQGQNKNGIYDVTSVERIPLTILAEAYGRGISWSPDGNHVAFTSDDKLIISKSDGNQLHEIPRYMDAKGLTGVAWRPSGDRIVTIGARITLHDEHGVPIMQKMHRPEAQDGFQLLLSVAWHPSGEFFVVGDYGTEVDDPVLQFWSADLELLKSITLEGDAEIRNVRWNRDGTRLATASSKLQIRNREGALEFEAKSPDLLWGVDWHPDGDSILTSSMDSRVTLWSATAQLKKEIDLSH